MIYIYVFSAYFSYYYLIIYLFMEIRLFANGCLDHEIIRMQNALEWQVLWANGIIFSNLENWI